MKKGDYVMNNSSNEPLYFAGYDKEMMFYNEPLLILATDITNKNTYGRYSKTYIEERIKEVSK